MGRLYDFMAEWRARRAGHKYLSHDIGKSARDVIGPTGNAFSNAWAAMVESRFAYLESFDRRIPPSLFVSQRDLTRYSRPIPLAERRIEAHGRESDDLTDEELLWGSRPPGD